MEYRRETTPGATYFFTVNLEDRRRTDLVANIGLLRRVVADVRGRHPFRIDASVILPDHLHMIWTLPESDADFAVRWALIKGGFSRQLQKDEVLARSRASKRERGIWQRRYWEHRIRDEMDLERHVDYVHYNPVKHGYAPEPVAWPYSSIHWFVRTGRVCRSWGGADNGEDFGEPGVSCRPREGS